MTEPVLTFHPASAASVAAFLAIVVAVIATFLAGVDRSFRTASGQSHSATVIAAVVLAAWLTVLSLIVASGRMASLPMSGLPFFFGSIVFVCLGAGFSRFGARLAGGVPVVALVGFQAFRLPLELVLHSWVVQGTIPETMTWSGRNPDIVSGIVALAAAPFAARHRSVAWVANFVGFVLLLNVMRVALLSAPVPFGWDLKRPLLVAFHLPYALIGPVCVGGALFGHIVLTRALLRRVEPAK